MVKNMDYKLFESRFCYLLAVCSCANYLSVQAQFPYLKNDDNKCTVGWL